MRGTRRRVPALLVVLLGLLGAVGVGRLAIEAWLVVPAPGRLPVLQGTATSARPFLLVILDGVREQAVFEGEEGSMPYFRSLGKRGASGVALAGNPTLTAACVRTLLSGRAPDLLAGFRNFNARPVGGSLVEFLRRLGARTAHAGDANTTQLTGRWFDPADVLSIPDAGPGDQGQNDDRAVPFALAKIEEGCDAVTVHLTRPDHAGHKWGGTHPEYLAACGRTDLQVRALVEAFVSRHPDATVLVAADHGLTPTGTHGGGEITARRAPFALVGPRVPPLVGVEIDQCSLAPTVAALLGLPPPPLADAPPRPDLTDFTAMESATAIDRYLEARAAVARSLGTEGVEPLLERRARLSVERLTRERSRDLARVAHDLNDLLRPRAAGHGTLALLLAALWTATMVHLVSERDFRVRAARVLTVACAVAVPLSLSVPPGPAVGPMGAGLLAWALCIATLLGLGDRLVPRLLGSAASLAALAALPAVTGAGLTFQDAAERGEPRDALLRAAVGAVVVLGLLLAAAPWRRLGGAARRLLARAPGLLPALGGGVLGFQLSMRPFVNPLVSLPVVFAALALGFVFHLAFSRAGAGVPLRVRILFVALSTLLLAGSRVADRVAWLAAKQDSWVAAVPRQDAGVLLVGAALLAGLALALVRRATTRDLPGLVLAAAALAAAYRVSVGSGDESPPAWLAHGSTALGLVALLSTAFVGSARGRLAVRLLASVALARRLTVSDAELLAFVAFVAAAALGSRWRGTSRRTGIAGLAVLLVAVRIAVFHAMGGTESFSTVDVAAGFVGIPGSSPSAVDAAGGAKVSSAVVEAGLQLALRFALPWVVLLSAAAHAMRRRGGLDLLVADLAVSYAARAAAIASALWAWWRNGWWMMQAYPVYAFGAADVVFVLLAGGVVGAFRSAPARAGAPYFPQPEPPQPPAGLSPGGFSSEGFSVPAGFSAPAGLSETGGSSLKSFSSS